MPPQNEIQGGRWDEFLRRKFNLKGGSVAPEIGEIIHPIQSIPFEEEDRFLLREKHVYGRGGVAAVVGEFSRIVVQNPENSGHLIIFEKVMIVTANVSIGVYFSSNQTVGVLGKKPTRVMDTRWGSPQTAPSVGQIFDGTNPVALTVAPMLIDANTTRVWIDLPFVLWSENNNTSEVTFENTAANQPLTLNFMWREAIVEPSANG